MQNRLTILIHSSKTMRSSGKTAKRLPVFIKEAEQLAIYLKDLSTGTIQKAMHISPALAAKTKATIDAWQPQGHTTAIDSFVGDIYSGLRAQELSSEEREYADSVLWILSGLYGFLRPNDGIAPYRLEMGYRFDDPKFSNLYAFWGTKIAKRLPEKGTIVNVSSVEYTKVILPFVDQTRVITPNFLTINPKTGEPGFTAVHAKIARGAFARWLISTRITDPGRFNEFADLGYSYDKDRSTFNVPVFICREFKGIGLSIRLQ